MFELLPTQTTQWVGRTLTMLPSGTITPQEAERLISKIREKLASAEAAAAAAGSGNPSAGAGAGAIRQIRVVLQDFTNSYRRRYVAPRDGLGLLEAERFHFDG